MSAAPSSTVRPSAMSTRASFPQVVVLPVPFTPTTSTTAGRPSWLVATLRSVRGADLGQQLVAQQRPRLLGGARAEHPHPGLQRLDELGRRSHAHVGGEQRLFDLLPVVVADGVARQDGEQPAAERATGSGPAASAAAPGGPAVGIRDVEIRDRRKVGIVRQVGSVGCPEGRPCRPRARDRRRRRRLAVAGAAAGRSPPAGRGERDVRCGGAGWCRRSRRSRRSPGQRRSTGW